MEKLSHTRKRIIAAVTNDLYQDQRMHRICSSLQGAGYEVELVGRHRAKGPDTSAGGQRAKGERHREEYPYRRTWLRCFFQKGKLFYMEYNYRLWLYLLFRGFDAVCAVDTDTLAACYLAARLKRKPCVLDAHEYFSEVPELEARPVVKAVWEKIAVWLIPRTQNRYTVGEALAEALAERYGVPFEVIRNLPVRREEVPGKPHPCTPYIILYQGVLNAGRGLEAMIRAMHRMENAQLWIAGEGDLSEMLRSLAALLTKEGKVVFLGFVMPEQLPDLTAKADIGINLLEAKSLSYQYSLANKALDYIQAGIPSIQMDFPEYRRLNEQYGVFYCIEDIEEETIADAINKLLTDKGLYQTTQQNCLVAAAQLHWAEEEPKLLAIYRRLLSAGS